MSHRRIDDDAAGEHDERDTATEGDELYTTGHGSYILVGADRPSTQWIESDLAVELER